MKREQDPRPLVAFFVAAAAVFAGGTWYALEVEPGIDAWIASWGSEKDTWEPPNELFPSVNGQISGAPKISSAFAEQEFSFGTGKMEASNIIALVNNERRKAGVPPLVRNDKLDEAADMKARDMKEKRYFDHTSPAGVYHTAFLEAVGYSQSYSGENLAIAYENPKEMVDAWMASAEHAANVLDPSFVDTGLVLIQLTDYSPYVWVAVQIFATPTSQP